MDEKITLIELKNKMKKFREDRDWTKFHTPKDLAISINLEAAELLELFQWKNNLNADEIKNNPKLSQKVTEELSDILSYILSMCDVLGIDISEAFLRKIKENEKKYPVGKCKGKAEKYTAYISD